MIGKGPGGGSGDKGGKPPSLGTNLDGTPAEQYFTHTTVDGKDGIKRSLIDLTELVGVDTKNFSGTFFPSYHLVYGGVDADLTARLFPTDNFGGTTRIQDLKQQTGYINLTADESRKWNQENGIEFSHSLYGRYAVYLTPVINGSNVDRVKETVVIFNDGSRKVMVTGVLLDVNNNPVRNSLGKEIILHGQVVKMRNLEDPQGSVVTRFVVAGTKGVLVPLDETALDSGGNEIKDQIFVKADVEKYGVMKHYEGVVINGNPGALDRDRFGRLRFYKAGEVLPPVESEIARGKATLTSTIGRIVGSNGEIINKTENIVWDNGEGGEEGYYPENQGEDAGG